MTTCDTTFDTKQRRRARFDDASRHGNLHGHTSRKLCGCQICRDASSSSLERTEPAVIRSHAYLDAGKAYGELATSALAEPYKLTAFEQHGLEVEQSLNRSQAWETVPAVLSEHSVGLPSVRRLRDGVVETSYQLVPCGSVLPDKKVVAAERELATSVYALHRGKPKLWGVAPSEPPDQVATPLLKIAALSCAGRAVTRTATVRNNSPDACWHVAKADGKPLDIDLGSTCVVTSLSTQGRHPATRRYPSVFMENGEKHIEDEEHLGDHLRAGKKYARPMWTVRSAPGDVRRGPHDHEWHEPAWVSRYALSWRADGGRKWHVLGVYKGNTDEMGEVAHLLNGGRGGVRARYLRVTPLETVGGGSMRIGVYGERVSESHVGRRRRAKAARAGGVNASTDGDAALVQYKLTSGAAHPARTVDGQSPAQGGSKAWRDWTSKRSTARRRLRDEATREQLDEWWESDETHEEVDAAVEAAPWEEWTGEGTRGEGTRRAAGEAAAWAEEQYELELALALSASLAEATPDPADVPDDVPADGAAGNGAAGGTAGGAADEPADEPADEDVQTCSQTERSSETMSVDDGLHASVNEARSDAESDDGSKALAEDDEGWHMVALPLA
jgi:hypothetical protein